MDNRISSSEVDVIFSNNLVGHNDLILYRVFCFLDLKELKKCRLVSRKWYLNCQSLIKNQSVIELHSDSKERIWKSPKKFLDAFQSSPLTNTFSGVRIICEENCPIFDWVGNNLPYSPQSPLADFLNHYGPQLTYFEIKVVDGLYISSPSSVAAKKCFIDFMPNIEHLSVFIEMIDKGRWEFQRESDIQSISNITPPDIVKLNNLKKVEWIVLIVDWFDDSNYLCALAQRYRNKFLSVLVNIIDHATNLNSFTTEGSPLTLEIYEKLNSERVSTLKEIAIDPRDGLHSIHLILKELIILGNQNLQLESFTVNILHNSGYDDSIWEVILSSLSKFISTQKDCLKILKIFILPNNTPDESDGVPKLPKMSKLKQLHLSYNNEEIFEIFFGQFKNWTNLFPILKRLEIAYDDNCEGGEVFLPALITEIDATNSQVKVLRLSPNNWSENSRVKLAFCAREKMYPNFRVRKYAGVYITVQEKFPNLKYIELYDEPSEMLYSFNGSTDNQNVNPFFMKRNSLSPL